MSQLLEVDSNCGPIMGLSHGLQLESLTPKKTNRWLFQIIGVSATPDSQTSSSPALPPKRAARPRLSFREQEFQHISESIWFPMKAEWQTINLTLYDMLCNKNPVFDWLLNLYDPTVGTFSPIINNADRSILTDATLQLYDGCGNVLEQWTFEKCYPQSIEWGELNMDSSDFVLVDLVLRYQRAFFVKN